MRFDAVSVLTLYIVILYAVPSDLSLTSFGGAGSPIMIFGLLGGIWWAWRQVSRSESAMNPGHQPVRIVLFVLLTIAVISYIGAMLSPRESVEVNGADLGLLRLLSLASVLLLANDGIGDGARFRTFLRRLCFAGSLFAAFGLVQFVTKQSFVDRLVIPGFSASQDFSAVQDRSGFARAAATATNPLEYAFVLAMILPIAVTLALDDTDRPRWRRWTPAFVIVVALAISGSRSGIVGLILGLLLLFPAWNSGRRIRAIVIGVIGAGLVYLAVPGMIGTVRYLFLNVGQDASTTSRTNSYDLALTFIGRSPLFGRGFGTFLPQYRILDNQYLLAAIELGIVGLAALLALIIVAAIVALRTGLSRPPGLTRSLGPALLSSVAVGAVLTAFSDAFSFRMSAGTLFLMLGVCGAYWRLYRPDREQPQTMSGTELSRRR
ncbi:O-antigen ligase family protein [Lacisediminihabitans changchengi]|uniref:O-antigen ligase family protein n=1 Tax=Lacisediminihabitans changchengi TaxID=2787634 RepID=A0A934VYX4_9MICO|nr:O-antigen ligase family protein [Lacisediminihabitans changchengi]MBK4348512.1 O-antigen ligase family protein [Lacisediminihabitans changchengi]